MKVCKHMDNIETNFQSDIMFIYLNVEAVEKILHIAQWASYTFV